MTNGETVFAMIGATLTLASLVWGVAMHLGGKLDAMRKESSEGRKDLHAKIEELRAWIGREFVTKEYHQLALNSLQQRATEMEAQIQTVANMPSVRCPMPSRASDH